MCLPNFLPFFSNFSEVVHAGKFGLRFSVRLYFYSVQVYSTCVFLPLSFFPFLYRVLALGRSTSHGDLSTSANYPVRTAFHPLFLNYVPVCSVFLLNFLPSRSFENKPWPYLFLNVEALPIRTAIVHLPTDLPFRKYSKLPSSANCIRFSNPKDNWVMVSMDVYLDGHPVYLIALGSHSWSASLGNHDETHQGFRPGLLE